MDQDVKEERQNVDIDNEDKDQQPANLHTQVSTCIPSEHLASYLRMLGYESVEQCRSRKQQIMAALSNGGHSFHAQSDPSLRIAVIESSRDCEYALLEVRYNRFEFYVWLLNVDEESPSHKIEKSHCGNFSTVYHARHSGKDLAVKCTAFRNKTFQKVFRDTLLEYLAFQMAALLGCGPAMPRLFAFDLLVFKNCIEFSMEFCSHRLRPGPSLAADLTSALRSLHSINVIHFDIKPENICFSEETGKAVFIDFGLHTAVREEIGQKSATKFSGSLLMCSEEMKQIFMEGSGVADLYYNDALCLMESLKEINNQISLKVQKGKIKDLQYSQFYILAQMKYSLVQANSQLQAQVSQQKIISTIKYLGNSSFHSFLNFIRNLNYSSFLEKTVEAIQRSLPQINAQPFLAGLFRRKINFNEQQLGEFQGQFETRLRFIKKLNKPNAVGEELLEITKEQIQMLRNEESVTRLSKKIYLQLFAQLQQINSWKINQAVKEELSLSFNNKYLKIVQFESLSLQEKLRNCFRHICEYVAGQTSVDLSLYGIIKYSLLSVMLLEIYPQNQLQALIRHIMTVPSPIVRKIRLFFHFLSCVQWLPQCSTIYCQYSLKDLAYQLIHQELPRINKQQQTQLQGIIAIVRIMLSKDCSNHTKLLKQLFYLQKKLDNKIYKLYTAARQEEQLFAELYVYVLSILMGDPQDMHNPAFGIMNKLLSLYTYRKQAKMCIYEYYDHVIGRVLLLDGYYFKIARRHLQSICVRRKLIYNYIYSPQMNNGQLYQQINSTIYFHKKNLSKMNQQQAFLFRISLINVSLQFAYNASSKRKNVDVHSLSQTLSLIETENFFPKLKELAVLPHYHRYEIHKSFQIICELIKNYQQYKTPDLQLKLDMDTHRRIFNQLIPFASILRCIKCKFHCLASYFLSFGPLGKDKINYQLYEENLLSFLLWRIRQNEFYHKQTAQMIASLCSFSSNKRIYEIFLVQYIINNNISPTFFYTMLKQKQRQITDIVRFLWNQRFVLSQTQEPLYFRFIFYLCRHFQFIKFNKQDYLAFFYRFLFQLLRVVDYKEFLSANIQYLRDNKKRFQNQKYSAVYFSIIIVNVPIPISQPVPIFYYAFLCEQMLQLNFQCRKLTYKNLLFSFLINQVRNKQFLFRKAFYYMRKEFKCNISAKKIKQNKLMLRGVLVRKLQLFKKEVSQYEPVALPIYRATRNKMKQYFSLGKLAQKKGIFD